MVAQFRRPGITYGICPVTVGVAGGQSDQHFIRHEVLGEDEALLLEPTAMAN